MNIMSKAFKSHLFKNLIVQTLGKSHFSRTFHRSSINMIAVGESVPSVDLYEGTPGTPVNFAELCKGKRVVVFAVPGAFTPGCSRTHLPGYLEKSDEFRKNGIDEILCISVNDVFVMDAWGKQHGTTGKIRMLADPDATFTKTLGLDVDIPKLGGIRSKRYAMVIKDGVVTALNVEPDGTGLSCSLAAKLKVN